MQAQRIWKIGTNLIRGEKSEGNACVCKVIRTNVGQRAPWGRHMDCKIKKRKGGNDLEFPMGSNNWDTRGRERK